MSKKKTAKEDVLLDTAPKTLEPLKISYGEWLTLRKHEHILMAFEGRDKSFVPSLVKKGLLQADDNSKLTPLGEVTLKEYRP